MMKLPRIIVGAILFVFGLSFFVAGGFTIVRALDASRTATTQAEKLAESCRKQANQVGPTTRRLDKTLSIDLGEVRDPRLLFAKIATIQSMCPFQPMISACIGTQCDRPTPRPHATIVLGAPL